MAKVVSISLTVAALIYAAASPYITAYQIKLAVKTNNAEQLAEHIDFPKLRESIKSIDYNAIASMLPAKEDTPSLRRLIASMSARQVMNGLINNVVTPNGLAVAMQATHSPLGESLQKLGKTDVSLYYTNWDEFSMTLPPGRLGSEIHVNMHRDWFTWKITGVQIGERKLTSK